jgi:hypothetical protein
MMEAPIRDLSETVDEINQRFDKKLINNSRGESPHSHIVKTHNSDNNNDDEEHNEEATTYM